MKWLACALILLALSASRAEEKYTVRWLVAEFPPLNIPAGEAGAPGYGVLQARFLADRLADYQHVVLTTPIARVWHEMEAGDPVCTIAAAKLPEREKFVRYSRRSFHGTLNRVIVRQDEIDRFRPHMTQEGVLLLDSLAGDPTLSGAYAGDTTYGSAIDQFIARPDRRAPLSLTPHQRLPLTLLDRGRVNFLFGHAMELNYRTGREAFEHEFLSLPTDHAPAPIGGYVACSRGPIGTQVMDAIDAVLADDQTMRGYVEPLRPWYAEDEFAITLEELARHP